jgi:two-component system sensor histidine kinase YesM
MKKLPLQKKILLYFIPLLLAAVLSTFFYSYLYTTRLLRNSTFQNVDNTMRQTVEVLDFNLSTVFRNVFAIKNEPYFRRLLMNSYENAWQNNYAEDYINLNACFESFYNQLYPMVDSIYFQTNTGVSIYLLPKTILRKIDFDFDEYFSKYANGSEFHWESIHTDTIFHTAAEREVLTLYYIFGNKNSEVQGFLAVNLRADYFREIISNISIGENSYTVLLSPNGSLFSTETQAPYMLPDTEWEKLAARKLEKNTRNIIFAKNRIGQRVLLTVNELSQSSWRLVSVSLEHDVLGNIITLTYVSAAICVVLSVLLVILSTYLARRFTQPINELAKQVSLFEKGNKDVVFNAGDNPELSILASGLNSMKITLEQLFIRLQEEEEMKRKAEIAVFQAQINPHFLYNTLSSIKSLVDMNQNARAGQMLLLISKYFHIAVSRGREIISLQEELEHVESYLAIMKMRYNRIFHYRIEIDDEELLSAKIMKFTLQPLVENAIYHGYINVKEDLEIIISARCEGACVVLEVFDDGAGIAPARLAQLNDMLQQTADNQPSQESYGLLNVHNRIRLYFGKEYGLSIDSIEREYTVATVTLPFIPYE